MDTRSHRPADDPTAPVARIVYASLARIDGSVYSEMERIRASAVRHNVPAGIHTALLYQSGWFVQWKEGPGDVLLKLMDRVGADPRHTALRIVHSSRGPRLLEGPWSMAIVQCADPATEMAQRVMDLRHAMDAGRQYSPATVWRRLSTPMRHPGAARQADPDAFQRVLVCSAVGMLSFDLVNWLARREKQEVVHRRFAGAQQLDVGTDYVDFQDDDRVMRVIAMARKGLEVPLTRAFVPDYSHLVLLLSGDAQRAKALVHRVAEACARLVAPPAVIGVAKDREQHATAAWAAQHAGLAYVPAFADPEHCEAVWTALQTPLALWRQAANSGGPVVQLQHAVA